MKYLFLIITITISLSLISNIPKTKTNNCTNLHKGEFYFYPKSSDKKYKLIRDGEIQKEITLSNNDTAIYKINWVNDCTYILEHVSGGIKLREGMKRPKIYTQFTAIESNYYLFTACLDSLTSKYCFNDTIWTKSK